MPYKDSEKQKESCRTYYLLHKVEMNAKRKERYPHLARRLKSDVFSYYSKGDPKCVHCGIDDIDVLTIDHINNNGAEHRRIIGHSGGNSLYLWLRRNNYPTGFQVLCFNCNFKKQLKEGHKTTKY